MSSLWRALGPAFLAAGLCTMATAQTPVSFTTQTQALAVNNANINGSIVVDLNNDGVPDLVIPEYPSSANGQNTAVIAVRLANGDGTFKAPYQVQIASFSPGVPNGPLFFGDFNNDGNADIGMLVTLATSTSTTAGIALLRGNGDGTFQPATFEPVNIAHAGGFGGLPIIADFNRDGNQDLVAGNYVFPGDGKGNFASPTALGLTGQSYPEASGDFDGDGNADIAYSDVTGSPCTVHDPPCAQDLHILYGNGKLGFTDVKAYHEGTTFDFRTGDLNSDGRTDIFLFDTSSGLNLVALYGQSNRTFTKFSMASGPVASLLPAMADVNGDGKMDLVVYGNTDNSYTATEYVFFLANTTGGFTRENTLAPEFGVFPPVPLLADVNRDNKPDIVEPAMTPEATNPTLIVALNKTAGSFPSCAYPTRGAGIGVCMPSGTATSPVHFTAAANSFGQIRKMELWVDGKKLGEQYHAWGQRAWLDLSSSLAAGTHNGTIFEGDLDSRLQKTTFSFTVGAAAVCTAPASAGVHICQPVNGSTTHSPVTVQATAKITGTLARMEVWVDGVKKYTETTSTSLKTSLALGTGTHRFTVFAVNTAGTKYSSVVTATVN